MCLVTSSTCAIGKVHVQMYGSVHQHRRPIILRMTKTIIIIKNIHTNAIDETGTYFDMLSTVASTAALRCSCWPECRHCRVWHRMAIRKLRGESVWYLKLEQTYLIFSLQLLCKNNINLYRTNYVTCLSLSLSLLLPAFRYFLLFFFLLCW